MRPQLSTDDMLAQVRAWAVARFGRVPTSLRLTFEFGAPFCTPFGSNGNGHHESEPEQSATLTDCERDVVEVLANANRRLTTEDVLRELAGASKIHGDSTVIRALASLTQVKGVLDNRKDARGKGYGLRDS